MKAVVCTRYGPPEVLQIRDVPKPEPSADELLIRVNMTAVMDYTTTDAPLGHVRYDLAFDAVGTRKTSAPKVACQAALAPNGKYLSVDDGRPRMRSSGLMQLTELAEAGQFTPVIDRCYPLEDIADAHEYVERGHKKGNVIVGVA